jgi:hypothetical protein
MMDNLYETTRRNILGRCHLYISLRSIFILSSHSLLSETRKQEKVFQAAIIVSAREKQETVQIIPTANVFLRETQTDAKAGNKLVPSE